MPYDPLCFFGKIFHILPIEICCLKDEINREEEVGENMGPVIEVL